VGNEKGREIVQMANIVKEYPAGAGTVKVVNDVSLEIFEKEFIIMLGQSGSGKTTLLNIMSGLITPTQGKVIVDGIDITSLDEDQKAKFRAENIGLVFQFFNLFPSLKVVENVEIGLALKVKDPEELHARSMKYLEMVGLGDMTEKYPSQLSGGQQQRVAVARALSMEPSILLADEPTGNLDAETSDEVWKLLKDLNRITGTTVVAVTHWNGASEFADRTITLRSGRIQSIE
jgi:putative ABC transport system ATP-binding protein